MTGAARLQTALTVAVALWGVGALAAEAIGAAGMIATLGILVLGSIVSRSPGADSSGPDATAGATGSARNGASPRWSWRRLGREGPLERALYLAVAAFILWALVAPTLAGRPPRGSGIARTLDWAFLPAGVVALSALSDLQRRRVALTCSVVFLLSCLLAALQYLGLWPSAEAMEPLGALHIPYERVYERQPGSTERFMGGGLHFHRLKLAHTGGLAVLVAIGLASASRGLARTVALTTAGIGLLTVLVFPNARAAALAVLFGGGVFLLVRFRFRVRTLVVAAGLGAIALGGLALMPSVQARVERWASARGDGDRALLLKGGLNAAGAHPIAGVGPGRFRPADFLPAEVPPHIRDHGGKAHNQLVSLAAETGWIGAALFLGVAVLLALRFLRASQRSAAATGLGLLAYFAALSALHDPLFHAPFSMGLVLALAAALTLAKEGPASSEAAASRVDQGVDADAP